MASAFRESGSLGLKGLATGAGDGGAGFEQRLSGSSEEVQLTVLIYLSRLQAQS